MSTVLELSDEQKVALFNMNKALAEVYGAMTDVDATGLRAVAKAFRAVADATDHVCDLSDGEAAKAEVLAALKEPA